MKKTSKVTGGMAPVQKERVSRVMKWLAVAGIAAGAVAFVMKPRKAY